MQSFRRQRTSPYSRNLSIPPILVAILVGLGLGVLAFLATGASREWQGVILIAAVTPAIVLLVNDVKKLILIAMVVDLALGFDIAIQNQGLHKGGPTGYMVSLMTIALVAGYVHWAAERDPKPRYYPAITVPALLFLLASIVSFLPSSDLQLSAFGLFLKIQLFLMLFYLVNHIRTVAHLRLVLTTALVCLLLESMLMVLQYFTGATFSLGGLISSSAIAEGIGGAGVTGSRVAGTLGVPSTAALYLNSMLLLAFGTYLVGKLANRLLALGAFSFGLVALFGTSSRGGWLALTFALVVFLALAAWTEAGKRGIMHAVLGGALVIVLFGNQIEQRLGTLTEDKTREQLATMAHNIMDDYPLGIGENTYALFLIDDYAHPDTVGHPHNPPHNKYLMIQTQLGPQGLIAFLLFLAAPIWQARRWFLKTNVDQNLVVLGASLFGALAVHLLHNLSETFSERPHAQLFWFIVALTVVVNQLIMQTETDQIRAPDTKDVHIEVRV